MSDGFLGRWSRRKIDVKEGKVVEPEPLVPAQPVPVPAVPPSQPLADGGTGEAPEPPPLTLEDVKALTADSDFSRFAAPQVAPEVKNAAMKKLFADPRYNVMDGMDVYTEDYSKPDPIPETMLRKLASAKFLGLFDHEAKEHEKDARDVADNPCAQTVAQSDAAPPAVAGPTDHADADLRLQQDHAAPGEDPGRGPG